MRCGYLVLAMFLLASCSDQSEELFDVVEQSTDVSRSSKYLTFEEAVIEASNALIEFSEENLSRTSKVYSSADVSIFSDALKSRNTDVDSTFYVINFKEGGAVLLAADRRIVNKVYGISLDNNFQSTPNPNQQEYMDWAYEDAKFAANDSSRGIILIGLVQAVLI